MEVGIMGEACRLHGSDKIVYKRWAGKHLSGDLDVDGRILF
jgi:hypothetical protein